MIIYSRSFGDQLGHIDEILHRIILAKLKLRPEKCIFASDEVGYLGFLVTTNGIRPDGDKVKAIMEIKFPQSPKDMIKFLGGINYFRDFIKSFSSTASLLYKMSQSKKKFREVLKSKNKLKEANDAFEKLKVGLSTSPCLAFPDFSIPFVIQSDASNVAVGGVLGQLVDNKFRPVWYMSRHLTSAETRYSTTERELLGIVYCAKKAYPYIYGRHVTFVTDHQPLATMKSLKDPMGRLGRLLNKLQDFDYTIVYQPGSENLTADLLSRPFKDADVNAVELQIKSCINWAAEQRADEKVSNVIRILESYDEDNFDNSALWEIFGTGDEWFKLRNDLFLLDSS